MNALVKYRPRGLDERRGSRGRPHEASGRVGGGSVRRSRKLAPRTVTTVRKTHPSLCYRTSSSNAVSENSEVRR